MFRWHGQTDGDLVIVPSSPTQIGTYGKEHGVSTQLCNVVKAVRFGCTRKVGLPGGKTLGQSPGFRDGSGLSPPPRSSLTKDLPQNQEVFSQGRFSKGNQVPPEARRTTSKCPLKRRTLQSPELAEISLLLVSRRIFLFCFVFSFSLRAMIIIGPSEPSFAESFRKSWLRMELYQCCLSSIMSAANLKDFPLPGPEAEKRK